MQPGLNLAFLTPAPEPEGGGRAFNQGLVQALRAAGHTVDLRHTMADLDPDTLPIVDGLLLPDLEPHLETLVGRDAVALVHHVSARTGRDRAARDAVQAIERRMLPAFRRVVATSLPVAERLTAEFGIAAPHVVGSGAPDLPRSAPGAGPSCHLVCIGVLTPRKGQDRLLHALARLTDLDWHLTIAGDATRDPVHAATIPALAEQLQLSSRVTLLPNASDAALETAWRAAQLFVLATSWEGNPSGVAEALRRGIPVVATRVGDIGGLVPQSAGILFPPDDPATFGKCLRRAIFDTGLRTALAEGAWQAGLALPGWPQQALAFEAILRS